MLKYLGGGFIPGIPAQDLTDEQAKEYGKEKLLASRHYAEEKASGKAQFEARKVSESVKVAELEQKEDE